MKTQELFNKFVNGESKGKASSVFIDNNIVYSYGYHFPLALRINHRDGFKFIVNKSKYSITTSKQQTWLKWKINDSQILSYMTTEELKDFIRENDGKELKEIVLNKLV